MPVGGRLKLKGDKVIGGVKKKKKSKKIVERSEIEGEDIIQTEEPNVTQRDKSVKQDSISIVSGKNYEEEFSLEMAKAKEGKTRSTPWGSTFRAPPTVLHGYSEKLKGSGNAEQRLDVRCAMRADKFCK
eukprot:TRINITY_DN71367_c0_g1_i1.p2 TRINITY_DN71367_c0_g1~~TRINITY_DN71367_c0_g1_i1.p2  ORF type:complete len:129 (-),score=29.37 TRINITY_DN71367_c0_g1_i1:93-479(-)